MCPNSCAKFLILRHLIVQIMRLTLWITECKVRLNLIVFHVNVSRRSVYKTCRLLFHGYGSAESYPVRHFLWEKVGNSEGHFRNFKFKCAHIFRQQKEEGREWIIMKFCKDATMFQELILGIRLARQLTGSKYALMNTICGMFFSKQCLKPKELLVKISIH